MGQWHQKDIFFVSKKVFFCYFKIVLEKLTNPIFGNGVCHQSEITSVIFLCPVLLFLGFVLKYFHGG